jgi:hypothetical protein
MGQERIPLMICYALAKGRGEGCDYTMGCNLNWRRIEADGDEQAMTKALTEFPPRLDERVRCDIESIVLLCVDREVDMVEMESSDSIASPLKLPTNFVHGCSPAPPSRS